MIISGLIGLAVATGLVVWQGAGSVVAATFAIGWGLFAVIAWEAIPLSIDAAAWGRLLPPGEKLRFPTLVWARWIRQSASQLLPVAQVGGDAVGARMMYIRGVPGHLAGAAVVVDLTLGAATQIIFTLVGLALLATSGVAEHLTTPLLIAAGVLFGCVAGFVVAQRNGLFRFLARRAQHASGGVFALVGDAERLDESVRAIYRRPGDIGKNVLMQLISWFAGTGEVWLACIFLGHPISVADAVIVQSLSRAARAAAFMVPGGLGVQEGGIMLLASIVGLSPETGLALALVKRVRELVVGVPALIAWQAAEGHRLWRGRASAAE